MWDNHFLCLVGLFVFRNWYVHFGPNNYFCFCCWKCVLGKAFVMVFLQMRVFIFALIVFIAMPCFDIENGRGCSCEDFCQDLSSKQWEQQYFFPWSLNKCYAKCQRANTKVSGNVCYFSCIYLFYWRSSYKEALTCMGWTCSYGILQVWVIAQACDYL